MRKKLFLLLLIFTYVSINIHAQYDCWSIQLKGGINTIRGLYDTKWNRDYNPEFGGAVEYTISPIIGIGSECLYLNNNHTKANFKSSVVQTTIFTSVNLTNLALKYRGGLWQRFNAFANVGGGFGSGSWKGTSAWPQSENSGSVFNLAASMGFNFEYNISRMFAVGVEIQYWWNSNGKYNPSIYYDNKGFYTGNINLRYKIPSWNGQHIRNLDQLWNIHI